MSFNVYFSANGNILGSLPGNKEMIVYELLCKFYQACGLEEKDKVTFTFKSKELKLTSCKTLQEVGIVDGSIIEVKSEKTLKKFENPGNEGNSQVPQNNLSGNGENSQVPQNNFPGNGGNSQVPQNNFPGNGNSQVPQNNFPGNGGNSQVPQNNFPFMTNKMMFNQNMNNYGMMFNQNTNNYGVMYNPYMTLNQNMNNYGTMYNPYMVINPNVNNIQNNVNPNVAINQNVNIQNNANQNVAMNQNVNIQNNVNQNTTMNQNVNVQNNVNQNINSNKVNPGGDQNFLNLIFINQDQKINIQATRKDKFCDVAKKYVNKAVLGNRVPSFLTNSKKIEVDENKTLEELEIKNDQQRIDVIFSGEIIGA